MSNTPLSPAARATALALRSEAAATVSGVLDDLSEVMTVLTAPEPETAEGTGKTARVLDRLAEETAEAAALLRRSMVSGQE